MVSEDEEIFLSSLQPDGVLSTSVKPGQKFHSNLLQSKLLDGLGLMPQTPKEQFCSISVYKLVVVHSSALPICREHWRRKPLQTSLEVYVFEQVEGLGTDDDSGGSTGVGGGV